MDIKRWMQLPLEDRLKLGEEARRSGGNLVTAIQSYNSQVGEVENATSFITLPQQQEESYPEVDNYVEAPTEEVQEPQPIPQPIHYSPRELKTMNPTRRNFDPLKVQEDLYSMGYDIEVTGGWDDVTMEALWDWQEKVRIQTNK